MLDLQFAIVLWLMLPKLYYGVKEYHNDQS